MSSASASSWSSSVAEEDWETSAAALPWPALQDMFKDEDVDVDMMLEEALRNDPDLQRVLFEDLFAEESLFESVVSMLLSDGGSEWEEASYRMGDVSSASCRQEFPSSSYMGMPLDLRDSRHKVRPW